MDETHREAVNKTADSVFWKGTRYLGKANITCAHWRAAPFMSSKVPRDMPNLIGVRFGRFTVVGLEKEMKNRGWVCRCDCGDFETRKTRAVRNPNNFGDRCHECRDRAFEVRDYVFAKTGRQVDQRTI